MFKNMLYLRMLLLSSSSDGDREFTLQPCCVLSFVPLLLLLFPFSYLFFLLFCLFLFVLWGGYNSICICFEIDDVHVTCLCKGFFCKQIVTAFFMSNIKPRSLRMSCDCAGVHGKCCVCVSVCVRTYVCLYVHSGKCV